MTGQPTPTSSGPQGHDTGRDASQGKARDARIVAVTALVVILAGILVAFGIRWISGGGGTESASGRECEPVQPLGIARLIRDDPDIAKIPQYRPLGRGCDLWLTLVDGEVVAVRGVQEALGCTVRPDPVTEAWMCDGEEVALSRLARWPLEVRTMNGEPGVLVAIFGDASGA